MSLNLVELLRHCQPRGCNKPSQSRGQYQWILHIRDHFSKYTCAYPLKSKESMEGAIALIVLVGQFSLSKILRCGNGNEFKGEALCIVESYGITLIYGRPRHPQTPGLIE